MSLQITGCGQMKIPAYKADAFNTYKNQMAKNDLHIAVLPLTDKGEQKKYFGTVLDDVNVLAIFIVVENRSAAKSFLLRDDHISLQKKTSKEIYSKPKKTNIADDSDLEDLRRGAAIASNVLLSGGAIMLSLALAQNSVETKAIHDNLFEKTLHSQTISPGKTTEGFAYFKLPDDKIKLNDLLLRIEASEVGAQSIQHFEFLLGQ
jgi:hypothetical protein